MPGLVESVVDGETGILVPPGDVAALTAAIAALMLDEERRARFGRAGRARMQSEFSLKAMVAAHIEVYEAILNEPV